MSRTVYTMGYAGRTPEDVKRLAEERRAFGNVNYKGRPGEIADFEAGVEAVRRSPEPVLLMCASLSP